MNGAGEAALETPAAESAPTSLRIAIDLTALQPEATGVDVYLMQLVRSLALLDSPHRFTLFANFADRGRLAPLAGPRMRVLPCCLRARPARLLFQQGVEPLLASIAHYDVVHSPSFFMPLWHGRARRLLTIHDLTFFSMGELHNRLRRHSLFLNGVRRSARRADLIHVPSAATRDDLLRWIPALPATRVRITPWGVDPRFSPAPREEIARHAARLRLPQPYVLFVGTIEPRKNLPTLIEAFRRLVSSSPSPLHLVLAGAQGWNTAEIHRAAAAPDLKGRIHLPGYVSAEDLPWLYRAASLFVYPSLCEGFGFPPLEAMASGIPVIASRNSALLENLEGAAELVSASDPAALAAAIDRLLADPARREHLSRLGVERARSFCWEQTARLVLNCYQELGLAPSTYSRSQVRI